MKRLARLVALFSLTLGFMTAPAVVYAAETPVETICTGQVNNSQFCKDAQEDKNRSIIAGDKSLLYTIVQTIVLLTGAISVIMVIIGGFKYVVSSGDANSTKSAKDTIMYALIGLVVAVFAQTIVSFVLSRFL